MNFAHLWKAAAKHYRATFAAYSSRPGHLLALMAMDARTRNEPLGHVAAEGLAWALQDLMNAHPEAPNYIEMTMVSPNEDKFYVTVQRERGKSPTQMRLDAEWERDGMRKELELARAEKNHLAIEVEGLKQQLAQHENPRP